MVDWKFAWVRLPNIVLGPTVSGNMIWPFVPGAPTWMWEATSGPERPV